MELVGIVRCPVDSIFSYGIGRQINQDAVNRMWKYFEKTERRPLDERNHLQGIVTPEDLRVILSLLGVTERALKFTLQEKKYPLLSGHRIACLDGKHRLSALTQNRPLSWWVVRLYCVQGSWLQFPTQLSTSWESRQVLQDQVEYTSHEIPYSDAEIYRLVRKYMKSKDKLREKECRARLTPCKHVSLKGLLKNLPLVHDLDALERFPGVTGGLKLGNIHKHLALHIDEEICHYLRHILSVWKDITGDNPQVNAAVDLETVQCLQFRAPSTSEIDRLAIKRMFTDGTLFRGLKDLDLRDFVRDKVLSVQVIIPSLETFHENMKYISLGAKFLRGHFMVPLEDNKQDTPTLYQSLGDDWSDPGTYYVEVADSRLQLVTGRPTKYGAYKHLFIAALRHFARLTANSPRQDVRGETMPSFPERSRIQYLAQLAHSRGFNNTKITDTLNSATEYTFLPDYVPRTGIPADWRGGVPFTKNYINLQSVAFPPQLDGPVNRGRKPSTLFVMQDIIDAFFDKTSDLSNLGGEQCPVVPTLQHLPGEDKSLSDNEDLYSATDREEGGRPETGRDAPTGAIDEEDKIKQKSMVNVLRPRSSRIVKERRKSRAGEDADQSIPIDDDTLFRRMRRSPRFFSEDHGAQPHEDGDGQDLEDGIERDTHEELRTLREPGAARRDPPAASTLSSRPASSPELVLRGFSPAKAPADTSILSGAFSKYSTETSLAGPSTLREPQLARPPQRPTSSYDESPFDQFASRNPFRFTISNNPFRPSTNNPFRPSASKPFEEHGIVEEADETDFSTTGHVSEMFPSRIKTRTGRFSTPSLSNPDPLRLLERYQPIEEQGTIMNPESAHPATSAEAWTSRQNVATNTAVEAEKGVLATDVVEGGASTSITEVLSAHHRFTRRSPMSPSRRDTTAGLSPNSQRRKVGSHVRQPSFRWKPATNSPLPAWPPTNRPERVEKPRGKRKQGSLRTFGTGWPWTGLFSSSLTPAGMTSPSALASVEDTTKMEGASASKPEGMSNSPKFEPVPPIRRMRPQRRPQMRQQYQGTMRTLGLSGILEIHYLLSIQGTQIITPNKEITILNTQKWAHHPRNDCESLIGKPYDDKKGNN
ncbi:uncharacterized protein FPRN_06973 [Fusarium proliferatum]|nr:uncharacterized protein FPRN_06973 [Fusarium proliferatum]